MNQTRRVRRARPKHLSVAVVLLAVACKNPAQPPAPGGNVPQPSAPNAGATDPPPGDDWNLFDRVVTAESVFPDPAERARYEVHPVESSDGKRIYGFVMKLQPGMQANRHFHLISVSVLRAESDAGGAAFVAGPNGGFHEETLETSDGRYRLRVSEGMLLPDGVKQPTFDIHRAAQVLSERYDTLAKTRAKPGEPEGRGREQ
jgi:hypothetical protein